MTSDTNFAADRPMRFAKRLLTSFSACLLLVLSGCADTGETEEPLADASFQAVVPDASSSYDAGAYYPPTVFDASVLPVIDSGSLPVDAATPVSDSGGAVDASAPKDSGGFQIPDLFPDSGAPKDAGAPTTDGGRNVNGPCKDLNLICFDGFDMWLNAECKTCNSGKGCAGCLIPFAF